MADHHEERDDNLHRRIINAALELFAGEGFHAVPVPRIADTAGVGVGSIYRVAPSKTALADLVFEDCVDNLRRSVFEPVITDIETGKDLFFTYWKRVSQWLLADPVYMRFMVLYRFVGPMDRKSGLRRTDAFRAMVDMFVSKGWVRHMDFDIAASMISGPLVVMTLDDILTAPRLEVAGEAVWKAIEPV